MIPDLCHAFTAWLQPRTGAKAAHPGETPPGLGQVGPPEEAVETWLVRKATLLTGRIVESSCDAIPQAEAAQTCCFINILHACEFDLTYI